MFPLDDLRNASMSEVLGRVAYRLIVQDYRGDPSPYDRPAEAMLDLSHYLSARGWAVLATWVRAYAAQWNLYRTVGEIRSGIINRARCGQSWRHVAFDGYKGTRGDDPRVTNRGVISRRPGKGGR